MLWFDYKNFGKALGNKIEYATIDAVFVMKLLRHACYKQRSE